jgi:hypothetical protein
MMVVRIGSKVADDLLLRLIHWASLLCVDSRVGVEHGQHEGRRVRYLLVRDLRSIRAFSRSAVKCYFKPNEYLNDSERSSGTTRLR